MCIVLFFAHLIIKSISILKLKKKNLIIFLISNNLSLKILNKKYD